MKHKKTITSIAFLVLGLGGLKAQETVPTAGSEATGIGGNIGQLVQQPFEISKTNV
jgi:hypothetical protein